jgi:hypothetical protein
MISNICMFKQVSTMNDAFGNSKGNPQEINFSRLEKQCSNILDEYNELQVALAAKDPILVRDALCDIMVFSLGAFHFMGADADADMNVVYTSNMSKFIKDDEDKAASEAKYKALGVSYVLEGEYPIMRLRCTETVVGTDGETYRANKILKSASYVPPTLK